MSEPDLIAAARARNYDAVKNLLLTDAGVDQPDEQGWTALCWAAGMGDLQLVRQLVEHGADVFRTDKDGRTPYLIALAACRVEAAQFLKEAEESRGGDAQGLSSRQYEQRPYCSAFTLGELRKFPGWVEKSAEAGATEGDSGNAAPLSDDTVVFLHHNFTVTRAMWANEQVVFDEDSQAWRRFCNDVLNFRPLNDFDWLPEEANR